MLLLLITERTLFYGLLPLRNNESTIIGVDKKITVPDKSITNVAPITEPSIFYSRPKGNYVGKAETEKVMLDFFVFINFDFL